MNKLIIIFAATLLVYSLSAQPYRYAHKIFENVGISENVVYTNAAQLNAGFFLTYNNESSTTKVNLRMDIYQPLEDTATKRPAIIFVHSGAFLLGNKYHDDMMAFCDTFALRGYVTASIDYRLGMNILDDASTTRAVYRGLQDGRAAVRFLRANASTYGIDSTRVYMLGSSAGGFIALQSIYMDDAAERPTEAGTYQFNDPLDFFPPINQITAPDLGSYDIGNYLDKNGKPDAVMSLWGAIKHPSLITADDSVPVFLIHGTTDLTVPFGIGYPFNVPIFPPTYGSFEIQKKLDALNFSAKDTYFVTGAGHEFYGVFNGNWINGTGGNAYWDSIVNKAISFFYQQHKPHAYFSFTHNNLTFSFTNSSSNTNYCLWDFGDGFTSTDINPVHQYALAGIYPVKLYIENEIKSWDTLSYFVEATNPPTFMVAFNISDGNEVISGAQITIINQGILTDSNGYASMELVNGTYPFIVSANGYIEVLDTVFVDGNPQTLNIFMTKIPTPTYAITFYVGNESQAISGADIDINEQVLITNDNGTVSIDLEMGTYPYTVSANSYENYTDTLIVNGISRTVNILLTISTGLNKFEKTSYNIYPNPANEYINILLPGAIKQYHFQLVDISGRVVYCQNIFIKKAIINLSGIKPGIYFMFLKNKEEVFVEKLIIK
ncbi:MAG: carboxylesterase family protein [Bacteroidetes bacterium]|nr:carboxylesterase family protein [Bacteroidota bacterium]